MTFAKPKPYLARAAAGTRRVVHDKVEVLMPDGMRDKIQPYANLYGMNVSRCIMTAIANELEKENPFEIILKYSPLPGAVEGEFASESNLIFRFMNRNCFMYYPLDQLINSRILIGIKDPERLMRGYKDLLATGLIVEIKPPPTRMGYEYPEDYRVAKINMRKISSESFSKRDKKVAKGRI